MTELQASYIQASSHPADTDRLVLEGLMNPAGAPVSGALYGVGSGPGELLVTQNGTPNMSVLVAAGHVWIDGTEGANQGTYHCYNDASKNLAISAAHATNPRKDLIVARVQDAAYSGATNAWSLAVVTGTPAASPAEPAVPANSVVLALVDVAALASSITNANITDRRRRASALGGIVVCTSTTRPTTGLYDGLHAWETDTKKLIVYNATTAAWVDLVPAGAWTDYTPTLTQSGAVTKTVNRARWTRIGRTIHVQLALTATGAGTGANPVTVSLPVTASSVVNLPAGAGFIFDTSASVTYKGLVLLNTTTTFAMLPMSTTTNGFLGADTFTAAIAAGDLVYADLTYEAAA